MEIVEMIIKIPEEARARLAFGVTYTQDIQSVCNAISEGIILPKPITYTDCANAIRVEDKDGVYCKQCVDELKEEEDETK